MINVNILLKRMMEVDPEKRVGYNNFNEIKLHEFFKDIEFHIKSTLPWINENTYFNFNADANFVIIDFFAIESVL